MPLLDFLYHQSLKERDFYAKEVSPFLEFRYARNTGGEKRYPPLDFPQPRIPGEFRGALAPHKINLPLPLVKGKGIQGIGLY